MTTVFLCAYQPEFQKIIEYYQPILIPSNQTNNLTIYYFVKQKCFLAVTGIGLVNAAISCQKVIDLFYLKQKIVIDPNHTYIHDAKKPLNLINFGIAGGISKTINIGDVYMIDQVAYHDFDLSIFGHQKGQVPDCPPTFSMKLKTFGQKDWPIANCLSADHFVNSKSIINNHYQWPKVIFEMEAAALAHTVAKNNQWPLELTAIKIISDCVDDHNSHEKLHDQVLQPLSTQILTIFHQMIGQV